MSETRRKTVLEIIYDPKYQSERSLISDIEWIAGVETVKRVEQK